MSTLRCICISFNTPIFISKFLFVLLLVTRLEHLQLISIVFFELASSVNDWPVFPTERKMIMEFVKSSKTM